ncbi:SPOR domain-containing protein [Candidatus Vondammii sp. HM_W22]|uniref:SPOR domain-containing protein n=1 Tax=Candidatus Vondammii sp. HM_W22 TaxID=2687299 RepID=UPI001F138DE8|nr:SPOR domain-containing protein [Candidatus Vondammii sp. HM_W22]
MDERLKKRLVGATVLISLVVIFVPMLLEHGPIIETGITESNIPPRPDTYFSSRVLPLESETLSPTLDEIVPLQSDDKPEPVQTPPPRAGKPAQPVAKPVKPVPVTQRVGLSAWVVQVGSFGKRENAEKVEKILKSKKFPAFIKRAGVKEKTLFRVMVGPEIDRKLAEQMLGKVNRQLKPMKLKGTLKSYQ